MTAFWVCRDGETITAAVVARYADPAELAQWHREGRSPELVIVPGTTISVPGRLPKNAILVENP